MLRAWRREFSTLTLLQLIPLRSNWNFRADEVFFHTQTAVLHVDRPC